MILAALLLFTGIRTEAEEDRLPYYDPSLPAATTAEPQTTAASFTPKPEPAVQNPFSGDVVHLPTFLPLTEELPTLVPTSSPTAEPTPTVEPTPTMEPTPTSTESPAHPETLPWTLFGVTFAAASILLSILLYRLHKKDRRR